jgi:hypothetical protein
VQAIVKNLSIFRSMPAREQKALLAGILFLPCISVGVRLFGLAHVQAWLDRSRLASHAPLSQPEATALGVAVNRAARHGSATCLARSLLLRRLLRGFGTESDLRIGVRFEEGKLAAHAWVELEGVPVNDSPDVAMHFSTFDQPVSPELFL